MKICLLGASFDTGNLGVSALAESSIKVILNRWPDAEVIILGSGYTPAKHHLYISGKKIDIRIIPIRMSKNVFLPYHFLKFVFYGLLFKVLPKSRVKEKVLTRNPYFRTLYETDIVADITGGDSFSDIYGFRRFFLGFLLKWLVIFLGKKLILLPQTYGPFTGHFTKIMAKYILNHATLVCSRDHAGIEYLKNVLNINLNSGKVRFAPDVAFILDPRKPDNFDDALLPKAKDASSTLIGLNISGLLFNGGYTKDNMFGLKTDYPELIHKIIDLFMKDEKNSIILVPHVFPPSGFEVESDPNACMKACELTKDKYKERILLANGTYNHNEIKYIIGFCDFFIGSRMHACIAAMSQYIPTVGLAYSKKFQGVFGSIGFANCIADAQNWDENELLKKIEEVFGCREQIRERLKITVPRIKEEVLNTFQNFDSK